jgi:hypothetical protein
MQLHVLSLFSSPCLQVYLTISTNSLLNFNEDLYLGQVVPMGF